MSSSVAAPSHSDPRRVSDPSPVAPVAQRPWDPHHRFSIANLPYHASKGTSDDDAQFFYATALPYDLHAPHTGSSRHSGSISTTTSHLTSGELPTPSTAGFGDEVCDHWAQLALQNFEDQVASLDNISLPVNPPHAHVDSPHQKSSSCRSKSSSLDSAHDGPPLPPSGEQANSNLDHDSENNEAVLKTPRKRGRAATLCDTKVPSSLLPEPFMSSSRAQYASEYMNAFRQARPLPFSLSPHSHPSKSPHVPAALFPSQLDHSQLYHGPVSFVELLQDATSEDLTLREYHIQQQNRLRRMTTMSQPSWAESHPGGRTLQPSPSSSFRRYHERASCDLSGSSEELYGQKGNGGLLRKRKSMHNKDCRVDKMTVREEPQHDSSGNELGHSDDMSSGPLFREVFFENEDRASQEGSDPPGGCSQGIDSTPPYHPSRFGGIGQGQSAHPPGLSGAVKPCALDLAGFMDETGEMMIPWRQELRCDEDLYTPMWCRGQNDKKEGFCDMCEGGAWFRLKNSAYWYHKQYFHGVSSTTGHYFYPPREIKRGFSTANRQQILGLCHECEQWVGFSSIIGNGVKKSVPHRNELAGSEGGLRGHRAAWLDWDEPGTSKVPTLWYKHAHKCHRHQTCKGAKGRKKAKRT
ncbi:uncharacterized protein VP01_100g10 [Puccinia sorghi]|uniref:Transcription regulator Rua1 C-terminal domain-containing protein n=1 Tax=Puccinia sorghi TaxID=27349 RepID=A0A0L6VVB3_9BASI|nr:uncharacterized protein VP01_100g10 [Puccinia sorghi]